MAWGDVMLLVVLCVGFSRTLALIVSLTEVHS